MPCSMPPMTDVVGHLEAVGPTLRVRTKRDELVNVAAEDVVAIKALAAVPVRTGDIRNLEHAAALAWPGIEHEWIDGWLLRYGNGSTRRANSAVPLAVSTVDQLAAIIDWYAGRGTPPLLAVPDRLFRIPPGVPVGGENLVMTTELATATPSTFDVTLAARPDDEWLRLYRRDVPPGVLTAVIDGELAFATMAGAAVGRAALTTAPDGTSWVGLSAVHVMEQARGRGLSPAGVVPARPSVLKFGSEPLIYSPIWPRRVWRRDRRRSLVRRRYGSPVRRGPPRRTRPARPQQLP